MHKFSTQSLERLQTGTTPSTDALLVELSAFLPTDSAAPSRVFCVHRPSSTRQRQKTSKDPAYFKQESLATERTTLRVKFQVRMVNTKAKEQFMNNK